MDWRGKDGWHGCLTLSHQECMDRDVETMRGKAKQGVMPLEK